MGLGAKGFGKTRSIMDKLENELKKENAQKKAAIKKPKDAKEKK